MHIRPPGQVERESLRASRPKRPGRGRVRRPMLVGSVLVHGVLLAVLFFWGKHQPPLDLPAPSPASFEMQFDAGAPVAASPSPAPEPSTAPSAGSPEAAPVPVPIPVPDTAPAAEPAPEPAPLASLPEPLPAPPVEVSPAEPVPAPPAPSRVTIELPRPPEVPVPEPEPQPPPPPRPVTRPRPAPVARPALPRNPFAGARDYAFGAPARPSQQGSYGPASPSAVTRDGFATVRGANVGRDWMGELSRWVHERWRYPEQAIANEEQGTTVAELTVDKYSRVMSISIVERSGSPWLDTEILALFRGRTLPPFPTGTVEAPVTITLNMDYVLIRR